MKNTIAGIHHITAIAGNAQRNYDFYTKVLGLRMVKRTVNFDDPGTYHFYYGNENGTPGTILTFFPWEGIVGGRPGTGMATDIGYSVPTGSLDFWAERFKQNGVKVQPQAQRFGETVLPFQDPDGLNIDLIVPQEPDSRVPWTTSEVKADAATKGFHSVTLTRAGQSFARYPTPWESTAHAVAESSHPVVVWANTPITAKVTTKVTGLAEAGERVGSVVFTVGTTKISVPLALDRAIDDPGILWRLGNPLQLG